MRILIPEPVFVVSLIPIPRVVIPAPGAVIPKPINLVTTRYSNARIIRIDGGKMLHGGNVHN